MSLRNVAVRLFSVLSLMALGLVAVPGAAQAAEERYPAPADGAWEVDGRGWGHGIGMSQWGAQGAALKGLTAGQILGFYYPGTTSGTVGNGTVEVALSALALVPTSTVTLWAPAGQSGFTVSVVGGGTRSVSGGRLTVTRSGDKYAFERRTSRTGDVVERFSMTGNAGPGRDRRRRRRRKEQLRHHRDVVPR